MTSPHAALAERFDQMIAVRAEHERLTARLAALAPQVREADEELDRLSAREREVMRLIARGYQYKEVAKELFISIKTVETHVSSVLRKLQLSSRHELTAWAMGRRLI